MNRLYFGDTRDLFKFDLVRHIMKAVPAFDSFTFIPMLTGTDGSSRGCHGGRSLCSACLDNLVCILLAMVTIGAVRVKMNLSLMGDTGCVRVH